jgi:hypothetical protein
VTPAETPRCMTCGHTAACCVHGTQKADEEFGYSCRVTPIWMNGIHTYVPPASEPTA